jgi:ABC-2 type transport system ATP-binding protein
VSAERQREVRHACGTPVRNAVEVRGLVKSYGDVRAVRGIDLTVATGECVAILGPNGAGKTTTVEILEGFRTADAGTVSVLDTDPATGGRRFRERIGIVLQSSGIERFLTVRELVQLHAGYYPAPRPVDEVLELAGIAEKASDRVKALSGGQQRRVDLALGLIGDPELIFLDEPTTGFDPAARREAWGTVARLRSLGKTVLLTTHYMDEAQHLADRVVLVVAGRVAAEGPPDQLGDSARSETTIRFRLPERVTIDDLRPLTASSEPTLDGGGVTVVTSQPTTVLHALTGWALERGVELAQLTATRPSLEDVYLQLTADEQPA